MLNTPAHPLVADTARPEAELLLCCARTCISLETARRIQALAQGGIDWAQLLRLTRLHGLMPLLFCHLDAICPEAVPKPTLDQLRERFYANVGQGLFLTGELLQLLLRFESSGIIALPFKGPSLASAVYGSLTLREAGDLDILVRRGDVRAASELLGFQGYRPHAEVHSTTDMAYLRAVCLLPEYHAAFVREDARVTVELHWDVVPPSFSHPLDPGCFWERLVRVPLGGQEVPSLAPDDLLLALCLHGAKHLWERLKWICDLAEFLRVHQGLDWHAVLDRARGLGKRRVILLGLHLANDLLGADLPPLVLQSIRAEPVVQALGRQVRGRLFLDPERAPTYAERGRFLRSLQERLRDRLRHRLRYLRLAFTPGRADRASLPPALSFLHQPLQLLRRLGRLGVRAARHLLATIFPRDVRVVSPEKKAELVGTGQSS